MRTVHAAWMMLAMTSAAVAQWSEPPPSREVKHHAVLSSAGAAETIVRVKGAPWVRVWFAEASLPGEPRDDGWRVRVESLADGAVQHLSAESLAQWSNSSAYFNGDAVRVSLESRGHGGAATIAVVGVTAGAAEAPGYDSRSICGPVDNRVLGTDPVAARVMPTACTGWLFNDVNRSMLSAGHCALPAGSVAQFNVPLSDAGGALQHPPPSEQYPVDLSSVQTMSGTIGSDWAYFGLFPNSETGLAAYQAQGECAYLASTVPSAGGPAVRVTGYGTVYAPVSRTWNRVQLTHAGAMTEVLGTTLYHTADTTGGNSGSPVMLDGTRTVVAIHTHGGCTSTGGANAGTAVSHAGLRAALADPRGVCAAGATPAVGPIWCAGAMHNRLGKADDLTGRFGAKGWLPPNVRGMAFDPLRNRLIAATGDGRFWAVSPATAEVTALDLIDDDPGPLAGLAFDPLTDRILAVRGVDGQLLHLDPETHAARAVGAPAGAGVTGLDADPRTGVVYALAKAASGMRLLRFDERAETWSEVGPLGSAATACHALACLSDGRLFTIDVASGMLLRIDPERGEAWAIGPTGGLFGSSGGMAGSLGPACIMPDFNADAVTDGFDMEILEQFIGGNGTHPDADVNGDYALDGFDLEALERRIGGDCS